MSKLNKKTRTKSATNICEDLDPNPLIATDCSADARGGGSYGLAETASSEPCVSSSRPSHCRGIEDYEPKTDAVVPVPNTTLFSIGEKHDESTGKFSQHLEVRKQISNFVDLLKGWYQTTVVSALEFTAREAVYRRMDERVTETKQIVARAKKNGTYLKAPNRRRTNLTEDRWALVRTKVFKEKFGDWEHAAQIKKVRDSNPIIATGEEWRGKYKLRSGSATDYILNSLRFDEDGKRLRYINMDTGSVIIVSGSAKEVTSHGGNVHLKTVALIPQIIENAIYLGEETNKKGKHGFTSFRYYAVRLKIGDADYLVRLTTGVANVELYYDHSLTKIKKRAASADQMDPITNQVYGWEADPYDSKDGRLPRLLQADFSRFSNLLDENDEPKVAEVEAFEHEYTDILQVNHVCWIKQNGKVYGWFNPDKNEIVLHEGCTVSTILEAFWHATLHFEKTNTPRLRNKMLKFAEGAPKNTKCDIKKCYPELKTNSKAQIEKVGAMRFATDYASKIEESLNDPKEDVEVSPGFSEKGDLRKLGLLPREEAIAALARAFIRGKRHT